MRYTTLKRQSPPVLALIILQLTIAVPPAQLIAEEYEAAPSEIDMAAMQKYHSINDTLEITSTGPGSDVLQYQLEAYTYEFTDNLMTLNYSIEFPQLYNPNSRPEVDSINSALKEIFLHKTEILTHMWEHAWSTELNPALVSQATELPLTDSIALTDEKKQEEAEEEEYYDDYSPEDDYLTAHTYVECAVSSYNHNVLGIELHYWTSSGSMHSRPWRGSSTTFIAFDLNSGRRLKPLDLFLPAAYPQIARLLDQQLEPQDKEGTPEQVLQRFLSHGQIFLTQELLIFIIPKEADSHRNAADHDVASIFGRGGKGFAIFPLDRITSILSAKSIPSLAKITPYKSIPDRQGSQLDKLKHASIVPFPFSMLSSWSALCDSAAQSPESFNQDVIQQWEEVYSGQKIRKVRFQVSGETENASAGFNIGFTQSGKIDTVKITFREAAIEAERYQFVSSERIIFARLDSGMQAKTKHYVQHDKTTEVRSNRYSETKYVCEDFMLGWACSHVGADIEFQWDRGTSTGTCKIYREDGLFSPDGIEVTFSDGKLFADQRTSALDPTLNYMFDDAKRLIEVVHSCKDEVQRTTFQYDANGRLQSVNNQIQVLYEYW